MKIIAGISSTTALLFLLSWQTSQPTTAFVAKSTAHGLQKHAASFFPTNVDIYENVRFSTALKAESIKITMPALSSTMKEGRVVSWLKSEGDAIEAGEAIMVVESDKADMDVEAFEDGYLAKIITGEGETAEVGAVVALVATEVADIAAVAAGDEGGDAAPTPSAEAVPAADAPAGGECLMRDHLESSSSLGIRCIYLWNSKEIRSHF